MQYPNEAEFPEILNLLRERLANSKSLMVMISEQMRSVVLKNFREQRAGTGGAPWQPLSRATLAQRRRKGYTGLTLQRTGALKRSVFSRYGDNYAEVGTNLRYAAVHQYGGSINKAARSSTRAQKRVTGEDAEKNSMLRKGRFKKGTTNNRGFTFREHTITIPARPFLKLGESDVADMKDKIIRNLLGGT